MFSNFSYAQQNIFSSVADTPQNLSVFFCLDETFVKSFQVSVKIDGIDEEHKPVPIISARHAKNRCVFVEILFDSGFTIISSINF